MLQIWPGRSGTFNGSDKPTRRRWLGNPSPPDVLQADEKHPHTEHRHPRTGLPGIKQSAETGIHRETVGRYVRLARAGLCSGAPGWDGANRLLPGAAAGPPEELPSDSAPEIGSIRCQRFLGGLLRHYYRVAA